MKGGEGRKDIERLTAEGLAEGYRLAFEAREAIRSRYEDWMLVITIAGLLTWGGFLLSTIMGGVILPGAGAVVASLVLVMAACIPFYAVCRRSFAARLAEQDRWMARLSGPRAPGAADGASTFDLLVEISEQVPAWLSLKQKDRFKGHPFLTTALFISGASTAYTLLLALAHLGDSSFIYLIIALVPMAAAFTATALAEVTAVRREREETLARWRRRMDTSRMAMEEMLGGP